MLIVGVGDALDLGRRLAREFGTRRGIGTRGRKHQRGGTGTEQTKSLLHSHRALLPDDPLGVRGPPTHSTDEPACGRALPQASFSAVAKMSRETWALGLLCRPKRTCNVVMSQFSIAAESRGDSRVEGKHAAEPFASADASDGRGRIAGGEGDDVAQALVVALGVVVLHELAHDGAQMTFAEGNDVPEALLLDRPNKPLGVGVEVRAPRRQAQQLHARGFEQAPEVRRIEGISIDDQVPEARQRARHGVGEVAGDLRHPSAVGLRR